VSHLGGTLAASTAGLLQPNPARDRRRLPGPTDQIN
jgi:hypothetical protein